MIRAKNEKDLLNILRLISSEAVGLSKKRMNENADPMVSSGYLTQYREDEKRYGRLSEEESEEEELPPEDQPAEEPAAEEPAAEEPEEPAEETGEVGASFDSVVQAVNNLRAGKSLRDSSIKQQAQNYYDKLSDAERTTLLVFLKALSDIIAGQVDGKDAQDPSDPPVSINMSTGDEEDSSDNEAPAEEPPEAEAPEEEVEESPPEDSTDEEDTTPPIKVNESQDLSLLRRKVRRMMLRG